MRRRRRLITSLKLIILLKFLAHLAKREMRSMELGNFISECLIKDMEKRPFAKQLIRHPFFAHVTERIATIRKELKEEIQRQRNAGVLRRQAEVTTKHGQLKPDRKSKPQKIYMDDLGKAKTFHVQRCSGSGSAVAISLIWNALCRGQRRFCPLDMNLTYQFLLFFPSSSSPSSVGCLFRSLCIFHTHIAASLDVLSEDVITEQLQKRFESNQIYTYIGDILVAVNPFTNLGLYTRQHQKRYVGKSRFENPPHIFAVADAAHQVK